MASQNQPLYGDQDLLDLFWKDDRRGLEILFKSHYQGLYQFVFIITRNKPLAEDIVQEVFINLWGVRHNLQRNTRFKPYLYRACKNLALNKLKSAHRIQFNSDEIPEIPDNQASITEILANQQLEQYLHEVVKALPPKRQLIFQLSRFQQMSYREIADHLDISVKTVENQMSAALRTIRKQLEKFL
ncbi:MAG: RNA polymerase sigma-70 factor [Cyclobacteriaceae bacterium]|nr:RNA polymerase sigma-70 factor [Cyclobacteriaceae bacterium]